MLNLTKGLKLVAAFAVGMIASPPSPFAQASTPNEIIGVWQAENGLLKFEMFDTGTSYAGRIIFGDRIVEADGKTFKKDTHNPDPRLRDRSLQGIVFLSNLKWNSSDNRWDGGNLYDASSGQSYSARVALVNGKMELRGYLGTPALGQTIVLNRAAR